MTNRRKPFIINLLQMLSIHSGPINCLFNYMSQSQYKLNSNTAAVSHFKRFIYTAAVQLVESSFYGRRFSCQKVYIHGC